MRSISISTLKAQLSAHLKLVQSGEEVLVRDRNRPIARIIPFAEEDYTDQQQRLIANGLLIPPKKPYCASEGLPKPAGKTPLSREVMDQVWREEREADNYRSSILGCHCLDAVMSRRSLNFEGHISIPQVQGRRMVGNSRGDRQRAGSVVAHGSYRFGRMEDRQQRRV